MITALGGGIIRDILIDSLPPATFSDWRYLVVAAAGSLLAFGFGRRSDPARRARSWCWTRPGLSLFAVTGASKALDFGVGVGQAVILGAITAVGGGTMRDVADRPGAGRAAQRALRDPGAVRRRRRGRHRPSRGVRRRRPRSARAVLCFGIRMLGVRYSLNAPRPPDRRARRPTELAGVQELGSPWGEQCAPDGGRQP